MGNRQLMKPVQEREEDEEEEDIEQTKKKNKKKVIQIEPYNHDAVDTGFVSPIKGYLPEQQEQVLFVKRPEQLGDRDIVDYVLEIEKKFEDQSKVDQILQNFIKDSRENTIGKMKFLRFIWTESKLDEESNDLATFSQQDCSFVQLFFKSCLKTADQGQTGQYMDYSKLLKTLHLMKHGKKNEQLEFFFSLFDVNSDGKIERDELNYFYNIFFEFLLQASFTEKDHHIDKLRQEIQKSKEKEIANALKSMSYEINQKYCNREGHLTYEQWQKLMQSEYLSEIYGPDDDEEEGGGGGELDEYGCEKKILKQTAQSFILDASQSVSPNVFTNNRQNAFNQTLPTETAKREEPQMIFKDKKELLL